MYLLDINALGTRKGAIVRSTGYQRLDEAAGFWLLLCSSGRVVTAPAYMLVVEPNSLRDLNEITYGLRAQTMMMIERFRLSSPDQLQIQTTITDPLPFVHCLTSSTNPLAGSFTLRLPPLA
jgi:hypothetical protein